MLEIDVHGERLRLLADKAVHLPAHDTLLIADLHVGKAVSFRRWGVPVPHGTTAESLQRLDQLIDAVRPRRVVFLGDFLHSARSHAAGTLATLAGWRAGRRTLALTLVRGNHDLRAGDPPADLGVEVVDEPLRVGRLALCHHPRPIPDTYVLAGHLHPCAVTGRGLDRVRLPCFWFGPEVGVLPAFGAFTGMHRVEPREGDRVFLAAPGRVVAWR